MRNALRKEKKTTYFLAGLLFIVLFLHGSFFIIHYYRNLPSHLIDEETDIVSLTIGFDDENIYLIHKEGFWYETDTEYYADHRKIERIKHFLQKVPVEKFTPGEKLDPVFTLDVNESRVINIYHYIEDRNRTLVKKEGQYYTLAGNMTDLLFRRRDRYLSASVIPENLWKKVSEISLRNDLDFSFVRDEESWKSDGLAEEVHLGDQTVKQVIMAPIFLHMDLTGLSITEHYDQVDIKLYFDDGSELSIYCYYPISGEGLTYMVLPEYEMTLGTREFAAHYLHLVSELTL